MNLNLTLEDFVKAVEEAEKIIPKRPDITVKNAKVTGVKLSGKIIDMIPKAKEPLTNFYEGLTVYQDDSVKKPQFIVEGEIETKKYLKWEDLEFSKEYDTSFKVKLGDSIYTITCSMQKFNNNTKYVAVETGLITYFIEELNKQFFDDLRLEVVEE